MYQRLLAILIGIYSTMQLVHSRGTVELQFIKYSNSAGKESSGNCCDGKWGICGSACDHSFGICMDTQNGKSRDMKTCPFGKKSSGEISNQDVIQFSNKVGSLDNPMKFRTAQSWPGGIKLKIEIYDLDNNNHDYVDYLEKDYTATPISYSQAGKGQGWVQFDITGDHKTTLNSKIRVYCDDNYYDANCDTFCKPGNSETDGFYTCDTKTGKRVCKTGWEGKYCRQASDPCLVNPCMDYEVCNVTGTTTYECICPDGKTGQFCNESDTVVCTDKTCQNGGNCSVTNGSLICICSFGWTGRYCEAEYDPCDTNVCQNNGTCNATVTGNVTCICEKGWTGEFCESQYDPCDVCLNNSTCNDIENGTGNVTCTCAEGWTGQYCETKHNPCDNEPCMNNGTCNTTGTWFECMCAEGFTGMYCEVTSNFTTPSPENFTNTTITEESTSTAIPSTTPKSPSVVITFIGLVKDDAELGKEFKHLVYDLTDAKGEIEIRYKKTYPNTVKGEPLTKVSFRVHENGKDLNDKILRVLSDTAHEVIDSYFTMRVYRDEEYDTKQERLGDEHTGWIHSYWWVVLIGILVLILLLVIGGIMIAQYRRRRALIPRQKDVLARQSSNVSDALPAQSFENSLYFEMNQPIKKGPNASTSSK